MLGLFFLFTCRAAALYAAAPRQELRRQAVSFVFIRGLPCAGETQGEAAAGCQSGEILFLQLINQLLISVFFSFSHRGLFFAQGACYYMSSVTGRKNE